MWAKLYFYFCIHYSVLTTRNLVSIRHIQWTPSFIISHSPPFPLVNTTLFSVSMCLFWLFFFFIFFVCFFFFVFHRWEKSSGVSFSIWLISLSTVPSRSIHVVANGRIASVFMAEEYTIVYIYHIFIHSPIDGQLGYFQILATVNNAATNIGVCICFQISVSLMPVRQTIIVSKR